MVFQTFVFLQVFNLINCRRIKDDGNFCFTLELNMFEGIHKNWIFIFIIILIVAVQFVLVEFGGKAVKCTPLSLKQHAICISLGVGSILICLISKIITICYQNCINKVIHFISVGRTWNGYVNGVWRFFGHWDETKFISRKRNSY